jgi:hypothetical protein
VIPALLRALALALWVSALLFAAVATARYAVHVNAPCTTDAECARAHPGTNGDPDR